MIFFKTTLLTTFVFFSLTVFASLPSGQELNLKVSKGDTEFDRLYIEDRDDVFFIQDMVKDDQGYLWVAAREGLYRFDGNSFLLMDNRISTESPISQGSWLALQKKGSDIWIAHSHAICRLNTTELSMQCHDIRSGRQLLSGPGLRGTIYADNDGIVYVGYWNGGLIIFDPQTGDMEHLFYSETDTTSPFRENTITDIQARCDTTLWIASHNGIFIYNRIEKTFTPFIYDNSDIYSGFYQFNCILQARDNIIWAGSNNGLLRINTKTNEEQRIFFETAPLAVFERNFVESLAQTADGAIWVATRLGLHKLDPYTGTMESYFSDKNNPSTIQRNYVRKVFADENNMLWIGHHSGALSLLPVRRKDFTSYAIVSEYVAEQRVHSVYSENQQVWFGTETGLYSYNRQTGKLNKYRHNPNDPFSISHNFVSGILEDQRGNFWISTDKGGLNRFDPKTGRFYNVIKGSHGLATYTHTDIWSVYIDPFGVIWCGTGGNGLVGYNTLTGETTRYQHVPNTPGSLSGNFVGPVTMGNDGTLWVGTTSGGLNMLKPGASSFVNITYNPDKPNSLTSNSITTLCLTPDNQLYIGSAGGIDILDINTLKVTPFEHNEMLPDKKVQSIVLDKTGNFWIATQRGLMKYEPLKGSFQLFFKSDGLPGNFFMPGSYYHASSGEIFMGTQSGFISFFPWEIKKNNIIPPIVISDIKLMQKSLLFHTNDANDQKRGTSSFKHSSNNISFYFASLDYNDPSKNQLKYKLEGFDKDWIQDAGSGSVTYSNLKPGNYTFRVIGSNNDNVCNMEGTSFSFTIRPPWWDTLWFKGTVFFFIIASIFIFIYMRIRKVHTQKKQLEMLVNQRTAELKEQKLNIENKNRFLESQKKAIEHQALLLSETNQKLEEQKIAIEHQATKLQELDRIKSGLFASISHEFRTPLTLILNAISLMGQDNEDKGKDHVNDPLKISIVHKNALRLQRLIDQLLDLVKIESGYMKLNVSEGNIDEFINSIATLFSIKAADEKITLHTSVRLDSSTGFLDWDKVEKMLYNLLSNAIKFNKPQGSVALDVSNFEDPEGQTMLKVVVQDSGCGIPSELQEKVFTMFFHSEHARRQNKASTGIGLSLARELARIHKGDISLKSEPEKGYSFTITVPCGKNSYLPDEINQGINDLKNNYHQELTPSLPVSITPATEKGDNNKPRILFVDDNKELCFIIREQLKSEFHVEVAFDGIQGVEKSISQYPDIIVSDLMMPGISGIEFCQRVKSDIRTEHLPFILLTARIDEKSEIEALESHADDYITKPYSIDALTLKLKNQLEMRLKLENRLRNELETPAVQKNNGFSNRFMKEAARIIGEHLDDPDFTVDELARELNMSRTQLYRKSEKLLGMSANNFIKKVKLNHAWELINDGEFNVSDVAFKVGFKTPGYFSRCFEEQFGMLPSRYLSDLKDGLITKEA